MASFVELCLASPERKNIHLFSFQSDTVDICPKSDGAIRGRGQSRLNELLSISHLGARMANDIRGKYHVSISVKVYLDTRIETPDAVLEP